jgi:Ca2+-binding RTX toxin-like protein
MSSARLLGKLALVFTVFVLAAAPARAADPVIAAAGDIACDPDDRGFNNGLGTSTRCRQRYTSDLLLNAGLAQVLTLGDNQYNSAKLSELQASYDPSWGRAKSITRPTLGNHEPGKAPGYFDYFNGVGQALGPAGERGKGYYSFDVGAWHLVALNSNCARVGCSTGSRQERWLRADLAAHPNACALAYWHHPRFSSGHDGDSTFMQAIWRDLFDAGVEVALVGHSHNYERFAPQDPNGTLDAARGIRQFVVGTGGAFFTGLGTVKPNSEVRDNNTFGVLELTLRPTGYEWRFVPEAGRTFTDSGAEPCHGPNTVPAATVVDRNTGIPSSDGRGVRCTMVGTAGNDILRGGSRKDVICGLGGRDLIRGRGGNDVILGGDGGDRLAGGKGRDRIYGNPGDDAIRGHSGRDFLVGNAGRDRSFGNAGNDRLVASRDASGGDRVDGGRGRDRAWVDRGDRVRSVERVFRR